MKKAIAVYSLLIGVSAIVMWTVILWGGNIEEGNIALGFHLYAEFAMAIVLLVSGIMMLRNLPLSSETNIGGLGMLIYSVINAAGYYGEKDNNGMMVLFIILAILSILAMTGHFIRREPARPAE